MDALILSHVYSQEIEEQIQPYVAKILLVKAIFEVSISTILCFQWSHWSDIVGRRPILVVNFIGGLSYFAVTAGLSAFSQHVHSLNPWYYLLATIPLITTGGIPTLTALVFAFISDSCQPEGRAFRMGVTQVTLLLGSLTGSLVSGELVKFVNASTIFTISGLSILIGTFCLVFFIKETVRERTDNTHQSLEISFLYKRFHEIYEDIFKRRPKSDLSVTWLCLLVFGMMAFASNGAGSVFYLFVRGQFNWDIQEFNYYTATSTLVMGTGGIIALLIFSKCCSMSDLILGALGFLSAAVEHTTIAFAVSTWQMYLSIFFGFIKNVSYICCRTVLTNTVNDVDIGKMNALMTSTEATFGLIGSFTYTIVYNQTLSWYPGFYNFISAAVNVFNLLLVVTIYFVQKANRYQTLTNEEDEKDR